MIRQNMKYGYSYKQRVAGSSPAVPNKDHVKMVFFYFQDYHDALFSSFVQIIKHTTPVRTVESRMFGFLKKPRVMAIV